MTLPHGAMFGLLCVIVVFPNDTDLLFNIWFGSSQYMIRLRNKKKTFVMHLNLKPVQHV